jgi:hypothetical protein
MDCYDWKGCPDEGCENCFASPAGEKWEGNMMTTACAKFRVALVAVAKDNTAAGLQAREWLQAFDELHQSCRENTGDKCSGVMAVLPLRVGMDDRLLLDVTTKKELDLVRQVIEAAEVMEQSDAEKLAQRMGSVLKGRVSAEGGPLGAQQTLHEVKALQGQHPATPEDLAEEARKWSSGEQKPTDPGWEDAPEAIPALSGMSRVQAGFVRDQMKARFDAGWEQGKKSAELIQSANEITRPVMIALAKLRREAGNFSPEAIAELQKALSTGFSSDQQEAVVDLKSLSSEMRLVPPLNDICSVCGEPQQITGGGAVCKNRHVGAPALPHGTCTCHMMEGGKTCSTCLTKMERALELSDEE